MVNSFEEFCGELIKCGFSMGGGNAKGIHAVIPFDWNSTPEDSRIRWHTGDPETDPWEWRMRVLKERDDIAYAKVFFGTSGYITKEWYPLFLTVRRHGMVFDEWYDEGKASQMESSIYKAISENGQVALHDLKRICSIQKEDASRFDRALGKPCRKASGGKLPYQSGVCRSGHQPRADGGICRRKPDKRHGAGADREAPQDSFGVRSL